jgi:hypothetical protein
MLGVIRVLSNRTLKNEKSTFKMCEASIREGEIGRNLFGAIQILKSRIKQIKLKKEQGKKVA